MTKFKTAHGSIYTVRDSKTSRFKTVTAKSFPFYNCIYLENKIPLYIKEYKCIPGEYNEGTFHPYQLGETMIVLIKERATDKVVAFEQAKLKPELGFYPFEWGDKYRHLGNKITEFIK